MRKPLGVRLDLTLLQNVYNPVGVAQIGSPFLVVYPKPSSIDVVFMSLVLLLLCGLAEDFRQPQHDILINHFVRATIEADFSFLELLSVVALRCTLLC